MDNSIMLIAGLVGLIQIILILEIVHIAQNTKEMIGDLDDIYNKIADIYDLLSEKKDK